MANVFALLQDSANRYPDQAYVIDRGQEYTFATVYNLSLAVARSLHAAGLNGGDRVIIYLDNSVEYIAAYFGALRADCIVVPLNKNLGLDTIDFIIADTAPRAIITNPIFRKRLQDKTAFAGQDMFNIYDLWEVSSGDSVWDSVIAADGDDPALILYTSGTTKMPKGVTLTHSNLTANTASILQYLGLTAEDSLLDIVNFSYSYGNSLLLTNTKAGAKLIIENRTAYPISVIEQLYASQSTGFSTVGSYINIMLKQETLQAYHLQHLRYITFAGESTNFGDIVKLNRMAPHIKIFVMYGQTEASARLSYLEPDLLFQKVGSVGKGIPGVTLRLVDEEGLEVPPGEIGEIIAYGENIMLGYWNNSSATRLVIKDGWLYTGDLAVTDEDGYIYIKGRNDDMIKHLGIRISPVEIESVINGCEQVLESAVIGVKDEEGTHIKAFVVVKDGIDAGQAVKPINTQVRRLLPAFKVPKTIEFIAELPRTTTGKIRRSELRNKYGQGEPERA